MSVPQSTQDGVRTTRRGGILKITMGPSKVNAIDLAVSQRVHAIFTAVCYGHALRITIVTGTGKGFYSLGRDMKGAAQERITGALVASTNGGSVILNSKSWSVYS